MALLTISCPELIDVQQRACHKIDFLMNDLEVLNKVLSQILDQDLEKLYQLGGSDDPVGDRLAFRVWQNNIKGIVDNYTGNGELSDKSLEIQKNIKPSI